MDDTVDGGGRRPRVVENLIPLRKHDIARDDDTASLVAFGEEGKEDFHLVAALLDVADVVEDDGVEGIEGRELALEPKVALRGEQSLHERIGRDEEDAISA